MYLCEAGPTGAETYEQSVYVYNLPETRAPGEWLREAAHEMGHALLPKIGRFTSPEPWGSGHLGERLALQWLAEEAGMIAGASWPAPAAQDALKALWGGAQPVAVAGYLNERCRPLQDQWAKAGADSPLLTQDNEAGLQYFLGFVLWVQAAHDDALLATVLKTSPGTNPSDYLLAYQDAVKARLTGPGASLTVQAGALSLVDSHLAQKPLEGALRREQIVLVPGDSAVWPLYLPAGAWQISLLTTSGPLPPGIAADFDGQPAGLAADKNSALLVRTATLGWHRITLRAGPQAASFAPQRLLIQPSG